MCIKAFVAHFANRGRHFLGDQHAARRLCAFKGNSVDRHPTNAGRRDKPRRRLPANLPLAHSDRKTKRFMVALRSRCAKLCGGTARKPGGRLHLRVGKSNCKNHRGRRVGDEASGDEGCPLPANMANLGV
jgi:hypothetical protein